MSKDGWAKEASYVYDVTPKETDKHFGSKHYITFTFPNAHPKSVTFTDLLYHYNPEGELLYKNLTAEMLQCYIDKLS